MGAAAIVDHTLIQPWEKKKEASGQMQPIKVQVGTLWYSSRSFKGSKSDLEKRPQPHLL